jgi:hypothetical protein
MGFETDFATAANLYIKASQSDSAHAMALLASLAARYPALSIKYKDAYNIIEKSLRLDPKNSFAKGIKNTYFKDAP